MSSITALDINLSGNRSFTWYLGGHFIWKALQCIVPADQRVKIFRRIISFEPMTLVMSLGYVIQ